MLTRAQMEKVIREGGSVLYKGEVISDIGLLPSEAVLAEGDENKLKDEVKRLDAQVKAAQKERDDALAALKEATKAKADEKPESLKGVDPPAGANLPVNAKK